MLSVLIASTASLQLEGRWIGKFTNSFGQEVNFSITFKIGGIRFQGTAKVPRNEKFLPKRVDVREIRVNRTFVIFLPFAAQDRFVQIDLARAEDRTLIGSAISEDNVYNVSLSITPENRIELQITHRKKGDWYKYELYQKRREGIEKNLFWATHGFLIGLIVVIIPLIVCSVCGRKSAAKRKLE
jgi:hypothetical protein